MGIYLEKGKELRAHPTVHYNCAQSVVVPFAEKLGYTEQQAFALTAHFGSGMRHGSACGALSGALLVLGAMGYDEEKAMELLRNFRANHNSTDCTDLLRTMAERGETKKAHCDGLVYEMLLALESVVDCQ